MDVNKSFLSLELWIDSDENSNRWNSIFRIISSSLVFNRPLIAWASGLAVISALCMRSLSFCWVCVSVKMGQLRSCFWHLVNYLIKPMASFASNQLILCNSNDIQLILPYSQTAKFSSFQFSVWFYFWMIRRLSQTLSTTQIRRVLGGSYNYSWTLVIVTVICYWLFLAIFGIFRSNPLFLQTFIIFFICSDFFATFSTTKREKSAYSQFSST